MSNANQVGLMLVGHGTRKPEGADQLRAVYEQYHQLVSPKRTSYGFLELAEPTIEDAVADLAAQGATHLVTVPLLLFTAGHAEEDIPQAVDAAAEKFNVQVLHQTRSLGCTESILRLSAIRFREAACGLKRQAVGAPSATGSAVIPDVVADSCRSDHCCGLVCNRAAVVLVGRGSSSASATAQMRRFAELRRNLTPARWMQTAFIHAQQPTVDAALDAAEHSGCESVVVQPHLLFEGLLMDDLRQAVADRQARNPNQTWTITETLGVDQALAEALAALTDEVLRNTCAEDAVTR